MACTIFEIFNCNDSETSLGRRYGEKRANQTCDRLSASGDVYDYLPERKEGFYVVDMGDNVKAGPFANEADAKRESDFLDLSHDYNAFRVVHHSL